MLHSPHHTASTGPSEQFQAFLDQGDFRLQRSSSSGRYVFEPRFAEPSTGAHDLEWVAASGLGEVYSITIVRPRAPQAPYPVVLVDLNEGVRLMSIVVGLPAQDIAIGMRVKAKVVQQNGKGRLEFRLFET